MAIRTAALGRAAPMRATLWIRKTAGADYFLVENGAGGWLPIGGDTNPFVAVFDGNSHTISGLAIRRDQTYVGLFGRTEGAVIRNLGLIDNLADYTGSNDDFYIYIGGLVGLQQYGLITASYATGAAAGGAGDRNLVGGLVGLQFSSSITASYATGDVAGGDGDYDEVGGLVGSSVGSGTITASYAWAMSMAETAPMAETAMILSAGWWVGRRAVRSRRATPRALPLEGAVPMMRSAGWWAL